MKLLNRDITMQLFYQIWRGNFSRVRIRLYHDGTELNSNRQTMLGACVFRAGNTVDFLLQLEGQKWGVRMFSCIIVTSPGTKKRLPLDMIQHLEEDYF